MRRGIEKKTHNHSSTPRHSNPTMNQYLSSLFPRFIDPLTYRLQLRLQSIDPVITDALDIENLDSPGTFFDPEGARNSAVMLRMGIRIWRRSMPSMLRVRVGVGVGVGIVHVGMVARVEMIRRNQCTFAYGDDVSNTECLEHVYIRSVCSVIRKARHEHALCRFAGYEGKKAAQTYSQIAQIQKRQHPTWKTSIESSIIEPRLMITSKKTKRGGTGEPRRGTGTGTTDGFAGT